MLDETMTYSCGIFESPDSTLADAQRAKLQRVCDQLQLGPDDHVLEIGCGWGGFALHAAATTGCRVTGLTISAEQAELARERVAPPASTDRIEIVEQDYRSTTAATRRSPRSRCSRRSASTSSARTSRRSTACSSAAESRASRRSSSPTIAGTAIGRRPDWIEQYVFPGCLIPSLTALTSARDESSRLTMLEVHEIGPHYAETLRRWRANFHERIDEVRALGYDRTFERTWDFYLAFCEAGSGCARCATFS